MADKPRNTMDEATITADKKSGENTDPSDNTTMADVANQNRATAPRRPAEHGGPTGLEPTRYGDWEKNGRCTDF